MMKKPMPMETRLAHRTLRLFDKSTFAVQPNVQELIDLAEDKKPKRTLNCVQCGHTITYPDVRIRVHEQHVHVCTNPHGFTYQIGCFREAPGVVGEGPASDFWSWFPGYEWRIERCGRCKLHLGWNFACGGDYFHGLILDRLVEAAAADPDAT